jgi:hypothetical protein
MNLDGLIALAESYVEQKKSQPHSDLNNPSLDNGCELILRELLIVRNGGKFSKELCYILSDCYNTKTDLANKLMAFMMANPQLEG